MLCENCAKQINDSCEFCPHCGCRVSMNETRNKQSEEQTDIETISKVIQHFSPMKEAYEEYERLSDVVFGRKGIAFLISGIIVAIYGIVCFIGGIIESLDWLVLFGLLIPFTIGLILIGCFVRKSRTRKESKNKLIAIMQSLNQHYLSYNDCPVEREYTNPMNLHQIMRKLENGEAKSIKEAVSKLLFEIDGTNAFEKRMKIARLLKKNGFDSNIFFYEGSAFTQ